MLLRSLRIAIVAVLASAVLLLPSTAKGADWGRRYLPYGQCCGGVQLDGTRAYVTAHAIGVDLYQCIVYSSVVTSLSSVGQLQAGLVRCGPFASLSGTCSENANFVKFVERLPHDGSTGTCYPHGEAYLNTTYLLTVDETYNNGTWWTFIDGVWHQGQSGYTNNVMIQEWGEYTGGADCNFGGSASFGNWQRYNYAGNYWYTVQSSYADQGFCWSVSALSNGNFTVNHR